jgi:hypothetical protein
VSLTGMACEPARVGARECATVLTRWSHWAERERERERAEGSERAGRGADKWGPPVSGCGRARGASWAGLGRNAEEGGSSG